MDNKEINRNINEFQSKMESFTQAVNQSDSSGTIKSKLSQVIEASKPIIQELSRMRKAPENNETINLHITSVNSVIDIALKSIKDSPIIKNSSSIFQRIIQKRSEYQENQQLVHLLNSSFSEIQNQLQTVKEGDGIISEEFKASFPKNLAHYREKFINGLFSFISKRINKQIFAGAHSNKRLEKLKAKNNQKDPVLQNQISRITDRLNKQKATRANLQEIGGNRVRISLPNENVALDGMHVSALSFRNKLKEAGARKYQLHFKRNDNTAILFEGIGFPKGSTEGDVQTALSSLGAFGSIGKTGAGWRKVIDPNDNLLIMTDEEYEKLEQMGLVKEGKIRNHPENDIIYQKTPMTDFNTDPQEKVGTVLLTSGNLGVYEMHKKEILAFLMRGVDVMTFNFRGYGDSTGRPTGNGLERDMEAVCQYLKEKHGVEGDKLIIKGLCMSGDPATESAVNHPHSHLFLDQSYSQISDGALEDVDRYINKFVGINKLKPEEANQLKKWAAKRISSIVMAVIKLAVPNWNIKEKIQNVTGHIGILQTNQDDLLKFEKTARKNLESASKRSSQQTLAYFMDGEHATSWVTPHSSAYLLPQIDKNNVKKLAEKQEITHASSAVRHMTSNLYYQITRFQSKENHSEKFKELSNVLLKEGVKGEDLKESNPISIIAKQFESYENGAFQNVKNRKELLELMDKFLNQKKLSPQTQELVKMILMKSFIFEDKTQIFSYKFSEEKFEEEISKNEDLKLFRENFFTNYAHAIKLGEQDSKMFLDYYFYDHPRQDLRPAIEEILKKCVQEEHPFIGFCDQLLEEIDKNKLPPPQIDHWINEKLGNLPKHLVDQFKSFIHEVTKELSFTPESQNKRYEGRRIIDDFLKQVGFIK